MCYLLCRLLYYSTNVSPTSKDGSAGPGVSGEVGQAGQPGCHLQNWSHGEHPPGGHEESGGHQAHTVICPVPPSLGMPSEQWPEWHPGPPSHALQTVSLWRRQGPMHSASTGCPGRRFIQLLKRRRCSFCSYCIKLHQAVICPPRLVLMWYCSAAICSSLHLFISIANIVFESERCHDPMHVSSIGLHSVTQWTPKHLKCLRSKDLPNQPFSHMHASREFV